MHARFINGVINSTIDGRVTCCMSINVQNVDMSYISSVPMTKRQHRKRECCSKGKRFLEIKLRYSSLSSFSRLLQKQTKMVREKRPLYLEGCRLTAFMSQALRFAHKVLLCDRNMCVLHGQVRTAKRNQVVLVVCTIDASVSSYR